jgi:transcriptional regulator with XRE-family HTH domain
MLTGEQVRAARALLSWSTERLADAACISPEAVRQFETGGMVSRQATSDVLRRVLEAAGAEFIADNGSVCVHYRKDPSDERLRAEELNKDNGD